MEGFAAFDPDEKDHTLGPAVCEVVMKDGEGNVVAKVCGPLFSCLLGRNRARDCRDSR